MELQQGNQEGEDEEVMPGFRTMQDFSAEGFKRTVSAVKTFQALPAPGPSWDLYKSYPEFSRSMKNARSKMIPMMVSLLKHFNIATSDFKSRDIDEKFDFLVESNDDILEKIGTSLDDAEGIFKKGDIAVVDKAIASTALKPPGTWGKRKFDSVASSREDLSQASTPANLNNRNYKKAIFRTRVNEKPQLKFSKPIDNSLAPFVPKLKEKPHSLKPLSILPEYNSKNEEFFGHPYTVELNRWEPKDQMLTKVVPKPPKPLQDTQLVYVNNVRGLENLMYDLLDATEIAVDLEHHSYRTYLGLTCTIQISTRGKDYVIDGLALREDLNNLNEVFTDPKILKVFHGATNDIEWLQRDFGLYVVNMFDTYVAAKVLGLTQLSLQYLLGKYCDVTQNKSLQLADWRLRPLTAEMLEYARQDTHFLLYIYDQMRNELIDAGNQHANLLLSVYDQSRLTCLKRYEKPVSNAQLALRKTRRSLNNRQLYAFTEIYKWRDEIAREKDESLGYVLPNHMLLTIAESLPKEMNGILACCDPVPPLIHSSLGRIHKIITTARELPLHQQSAQKDKVDKKVKQKNWIIAVNSIHDIAPAETLDDVLPTSGKTLFEEKSSTKSSNNPTNSWPLPWTEPDGWQSCLNTNNCPSLKFNQKRVLFTKSKPEKPLPTSSFFGVVDSETLSTPFGRYEISKKITEMIKDPAKQKDLDMNDSLVKTVYEAVMLVVDETDADKDSDMDQLPAQPTKVLDDGEFIPFNPMAEPANKKRKKKNKHEAWDDGPPEDEEEEQRNTVEDQGIETEDVEYVARVDSSSTLNSNSKKSRRKKSGSKFLNKIKNVFQKSKDREKNDKVIQEEPEEGEIEDDENEVVEIDPPPRDTRKSANPSPPSKRARMERSGSNYRQPGNFSGSSGDRDNAKFNTSPHPRHGRKFQKGDRNKNKAGIFKAFKKDHRSVTFK